MPEVDLSAWQGPVQLTGGVIGQAEDRGGQGDNGGVCGVVEGEGLDGAGLR